MFALLDRILTESAKANGTGRSGDIVAMLLKKRFLSSPWAFGMTLQSVPAPRGRLGLAPTDDDYDDVLGEGQADEEEGRGSRTRPRPCGTARAPTRWSPPRRASCSDWPSGG